MPNPFEKPYQPSPEEIKKAEEMMTEEQKEKSKEREIDSEKIKEIDLKEEELKNHLEKIEKELIETEKEIRNLEREKIAIIASFSERLKEVFIKGQFKDFENSDSPNLRPVDKELFKEFIEKFYCYEQSEPFAAKSYNNTYLSKIDVCEAEYLVKDKEIIDLLTRKNGSITIKGSKELKRYFENIMGKEWDGPRGKTITLPFYFNICDGPRY